jgi:small subunit ribosomal protein S8
MFNHPVSDLVSRIKNGYMANRQLINSPASSLRSEILKVLKDEGFILNYTKNAEDKNLLDIHLRYSGSAPAVSEISVISKPGKKIYCGHSDIPLIKNGLGTVVISTSQGILSGYEAKSKKLGGEILLKIF